VLEAVASLTSYSRPKTQQVLLQQHLLIVLRLAAKGRFFICAALLS
jgi:hypothetical protein